MLYKLQSCVTSRLDTVGYQPLDVLTTRARRLKSACAQGDGRTRATIRIVLYTSFLFRSIFENTRATRDTKKYLICYEILVLPITISQINHIDEIPAKSQFFIRRKKNCIIILIQFLKRYPCGETHRCFSVQI